MQVNYVSKGLTQENTYFRDTEGNASSLTREGEMNLSVIPIMEQNGKLCFLDGTHIPKPNDKYNRELLSQNSLGVPSSWRRILPESQEGLYYLPMRKQKKVGDLIMKWLFALHSGKRFAKEKMNSFNLLTENWIPVLQQGKFETISLKTLAL